MSCSARLVVATVGSRFSLRDLQWLVIESYANWPDGPGPTKSSSSHNIKIGVLSERVEQLQNELSHESTKSDRLTTELEEANADLAELRLKERNLVKQIEHLLKQVGEAKEAASQKAGQMAEAGEQKTECWMENGSLNGFDAAELDRVESALAKNKSQQEVCPRVRA
ncbi:unnamed protein product [Protopolystoma xenopodis]|uniref:Uncharacterized protein n=1 Tax=Protopolystoma xenopodis TaxID=117903 RepID=A0A3S5B2W6_9PLAT|nr:unnamed protein product [Protopolystoma xenopodis]